jgi:hypothetical protein
VINFFMEVHMSSSLSSSARERSPAELREELASAGDVAGLLALIQQSPSWMLELGPAFEQLRRAIDVASRSDPAGFSTEVFRVATSFSTYAMLRLQFLCERSLEQDFARGGDGRLSNEFTSLNPQLQQLQTHLAGLLQGWASTARQWQLVQRRATEAGPPPAESSQNAPRPTKPRKRTPPNRLRDLLDGSDY